MQARLIIDCDPGQDDAINLFMALSTLNTAKILGIVTVAGNVPLDKTTRNARLVCDIAGRRDIPVFAGASAPLKLPLATAEFIHGREGLHGIDIFEPNHPLETQTGVDFIIETLACSPERSVTLVATGPLTNIAQAFKNAPDIMPKVKEIILMGGAFREGGNITPSAEFNIYVDPHAAQIVFDSPCPKVVFGLDVTYQVLTSSDMIGRIGKIQNSAARAVHGILQSYERSDTARFKDNVAPLHDPCTIAYIMCPEIFKLKACNIKVEADSALTRGHTSVDFWNRTDLPKNSQWAYSADRKLFFELLIKILESYD